MLNLSLCRCELSNLVVIRALPALSRSGKELEAGEGAPDAILDLSYLVSGTKSTQTTQLIRVKMKAIHLCQRHDVPVMTKPQMRGPTVLPPLIALR